jgi:hypothetical protein
MNHSMPCRSPLLSPSPFLLIAFVLLIATGCSRSLSKAQVDRVKLGMTVADVEDILGKGNPIDAGEVEKLAKGPAPAATTGPKVEFDSSEMRGMKWGDDKKSVTVIYKNDKVYRIFSQGL